MIQQVSHTLTGASELVLGTAPAHNGTFNHVTIDGVEIVTVDGTPVGYVTGISGPAMTIAITSQAAFNAINQNMLHVVSTAYYGNYDSVVLGDQGSITQLVSGPRDTTKPLPSLVQEIQTTERDRTIQTLQPDNGANDTLYGNGGDSILIGGTGDDSIDGGTGRALIFGDLVSLDRSSSVTPISASCPTQLGCFASPLYQDLTNTEEYSTAIGATTAGEGALLNDGKAQVDQWWATRAGATTRSRSSRWIRRGSRTRSSPPQPPHGGRCRCRHDLRGARQRGRDPGRQLDDQRVAHPYVPIGAAAGRRLRDRRGCTTGAQLGTATVGDRVGACIDLDERPSTWSISRPSDSGDYIEGGGGNNIIFGNPQGQNDIIGGSSDFFGTSTPAQRTSGSNQIFSGSGTELDQEDPGDTSAQGHDTNSTVIVGNNGEIIASSGRTGSRENAAGGVILGATGFLQYDYDNYIERVSRRPAGRATVSRRHARQHLGGPTLAGQLGPAVQGTRATNGSR